MDCSIFYQNGVLLPWSGLPTWYVKFLASSPPDEKNRIKSQKRIREKKSNHLI